MLDFITDIGLAISAPLFDWLLVLPVDGVLLIVAVVTGAILAFVRVWTTNQDRLRRAKADKRRLKELIREAKREGDRARIKRHREANGIVAVRLMNAEWLPLAASLVPIAIIAVWCFARLEFHPPQAGEEVELRAYFPASEIDRLAHVVPLDGLEARDPDDRWIRRIEKDPVPNPDGSVNGLAVWRLAGKAREEPYSLALRHRGATHERPLVVGRRDYAPPLLFHDGELTATELRMRRVKPFGFVPGLPWKNVAVAGTLIPANFLAPWIVAYLLIAIPLTFVFKRLFGIA
ncbi:MAG: hypothetical protein WD066_09175 [Planctomycetaceae bacterium]